MIEWEEQAKAIKDRDEFLALQWQSEPMYLDDAEG